MFRMCIYTLMMQDAIYKNQHDNNCNEFKQLRGFQCGLKYAGNLILASLKKRIVQPLFHIVIAHLWTINF